MALEAMPFHQELFGYGIDTANHWSSADFGPLEEENELISSFNVLGNQETQFQCDPGCVASPPLMLQHFGDWVTNNTIITPSEHGFSSPVLAEAEELPSQEPNIISTDMAGGAKSRGGRRRRTGSKKNKEEIENQRMTHIAVERNRRKQMNEYLSVLRGLMPDTYALKGDQASIIGGAINYVKELEHQLHFLSGQKGKTENNQEEGGSSPFQEFFTFPQYTTADNVAAAASTGGGCGGDQPPAAADIEVTMADNHANLKIRSEKRVRRLSKMVCGLQNLRLTVLHLNVVTVDGFVLYTLSLKVEDECRLNSIEEIAAAVNHMLLQLIY